MSRNNRSKSQSKSQQSSRKHQWYRIDLHVHSPASEDYHEPDVSLLDILHKAETRGANIIAITDHNTVRGYAALKQGIENLELLESLERITQDEQSRLNEYRRLMDKILVLPGIEFTATFGFHILGIFPKDTSIRRLEHVLLKLNIPERSLDTGSGQVGATTDVLTAYEVLRDAGALVIPAHVNSTNGVAMQGLPFGGQTKIAFTQSPNIDALEATDLESTSRRSTRKFFNGSKPDYPRRMHVIQGSDAHRINRDPERESNLGVGDRMTEVQLTEPTFEELADLFRSDNFGRTRPHRPSQDPYDFIRTARSEGDTIVQAFHARPPKRRGKMSPIVRDVVALANGHGGTIFVGLSADATEEVIGVENAKEQVKTIREDVARQIIPPISVTIDIGATDKKSVIVISVPAGHEKPYAVAPGNIYVRQEGETTLALRDEIVELVRSGLESANGVLPPIGSTLHEAEPQTKRETAPAGREQSRRRQSQPARQPVEPAEQPEAATEAEEEKSGAPLPRTGVEIVDSDERNGITYHSMRDLRNMKVVHNVTRDSARRLWRYAITQQEQNPVKPDEVEWKNDRGFWKAYKPRGQDVRFNLAYRDNGQIRVFYGVTEDGLDAEWREIIPDKYVK